MTEKGTTDVRSGEIKTRKSVVFLFHIQILMSMIDLLIKYKISTQLLTVLTTSAIVLLEQTK